MGELSDCYCVLKTDKFLWAPREQHLMVHETEDTGGEYQDWAMFAVPVEKSLKLPYIAFATCQSRHRRAPSALAVIHWRPPSWTCQPGLQLSCNALAAMDMLILSVSIQA